MAPIRPTSLRSIITGLWASWLVITILKALQHHTMPLQESTEISLALISVHAVFLILMCLAVRPLKFGIIILGAYMARLVALFTDRLTNFEVPFLGSPDADGFYLAAVTISEDLSLAGDTYGGVYAALLGYLFNLIGPERLLGQYLNIMLSISTLCFLAGVLRQLHIGPRVMQLVLSLLAFMPLVIAHTSSLLREPLVQTLVTAALFCFVKGITASQTSWTLSAILLILAASTIHAGVVGVLVGFALAAAFTSERDGQLVFGLRRVAPAIVMSLAVVIAMLQHPEIFLGKFQTVESAEDLLDHGLTGRGGSAYLQTLEIDSWGTFVLFAPLRALYFVVAPMPWDWRGIQDLFAFGLDSIVYVAVIVFFISRRIKDPRVRYLALALSFVLMITCLIFGVGVSNSGTAIRHRGKLLGIFLVLLAILLDFGDRKTGADRDKIRQAHKPHST